MSAVAVKTDMAVRKTVTVINCIFIEPLFYGVFHKGEFDNV